MYCTPDSRKSTVLGDDVVDILRNPVKPDDKSLFILEYLEFAASCVITRFRFLMMFEYIIFLFSLVG